jgi:hypothetical protein
MTSPDPVDEPAAYQALLLSLLGDDDPAAVQAATPGTLRRLLDEAGPDLRTRPRAAEWSVLECAGHILDAEVVYSGRYRFIVAHDQPALPGYDQDLWVERLHHADDDPAALLAQFEAMRTANLALWRRMPAKDRARVGLHAERGPESYELSFRLIAGHDRFHLDQARRALAEVRAR